MSELVIFQWGRLGDVVQTLPIVKRWNQQRGGKVSLLYDRRYDAVAIRCFESCELFPLNLRELNRIAATQSGGAVMHILLRKLQGASDSLGGKRHLILNDSPAATLFSALLEPSAQSGYSFRAGKHRRDRILEEYLRGASDIRPWPMHLIDVWSLCAGLELTDVNDTVHSPDDQIGVPEIALICDAGSPARTPPVGWMHSLAQHLSGNSATRVTLVGSKPGVVGEGEFELDSIRDLRGRTSLDELISVLEHSDVVIGPDTGALHLASALGKPTIGLFNGGAAALNTGPYSLHSTVLHDLKWTDDEINYICELAGGILRGTQGVDLSALPIWRARVDSTGLLYSSDSLPRPEVAALLELRHRFLTCIVESQPSVPERA